MVGGSKWTSWSAKLYYVLGFFYYVYHWFLIGGGVGLLVTLGTYSIGGAPVYTVVAAILSFGLLALGATFFVTNLRKRYKGSNPGLKLHSSSVVYRDLGGGDYEYAREIEVEAAFDGVDHFTHVFGWTGEGQIVAFAENGHRAEISDDDKSNDKTLRLSFTPQRKRAKFTLGYKILMSDEGKKAKNFFRTFIHEKVRILNCQIEFRPDRCPSKYKREVYMSPVSTIPIYSEELSINRNENMIKWTIKKPRFDCNYVITW